MTDISESGLTKEQLHDFCIKNWITIQKRGLIVKPLAVIPGHHYKLYSNGKWIGVLIHSGYGWDVTIQYNNIENNPSFKDF